MNDPEFSEDKLLDLLADKAAFDLTDQEQLELERLFAGSDLDGDLYEQVAGISMIAMNPWRDVGLPATLEKKILASALAKLGDSSSVRRENAAEDSVGRQIPDERLNHRETNRRWYGVLGWMAIAVCLLLMFVNRPVPRPPAQTPQQARTTLIKSVPGTARWWWTPTSDPAATGASGDVVWNTERQEGYALFRGLPKQNPSQMQYQLWLYDTDRDERYPVSAAVFDFDPANGFCVVALKPSVHVRGPIRFTVTLERSGGVVVSNGSRTLLTSTQGA